jgi:hypothetical protein
MGEIDTTKKQGFWDYLQQPSCFLGSSEETYRMLLAALDLGWQVVEPVFLRPQWGEGDQWVFHFVLKQNLMSQACLITTRYSPDIERLVFEEGWQVDRFPIKGNPLDVHLEKIEALTLTSFKR